MASSCENQQRDECVESKESQEEKHCTSVDTLSTSGHNDANSGLSSVVSSADKDLTYQLKKSFDAAKDDVHPFGIKPQPTASEQETDTSGAVLNKAPDVSSVTDVTLFMKNDSVEGKEKRTTDPKTVSDDLRVFQNMAGVESNNGKEKQKETEDDLLGFGSKQIGGVNIEEIDEAVEKALLEEDVYTDKVSVKNDSRPAEEDMEVSTVASLLTSESDLSFQRPKSFTIVDNSSKDSSVVNNMDMDVETELRKEDTLPLHRPEQVYNIDEETRMSLDQTSNDNSMLASSFNYPLPPKRLFHLDDTKDSGASDNDTKLSTMTDTEDVRLSHTISIDPEATKDSVASDSNAADSSTPAKRSRRDVIAEGFEDGEHIFLAENLFEYQWPLDGGEWHLLQEQISEFLKVKSFKRKYPDLYRRICDKEEKNFLREKGVVTETQSDLGLTALRSEEVYDLMMKDYNDKYREYISVLQEKQKRVIREKHKEYSDQAKLDKSKIESYSKKAARSAAEFNASLMRENREERRAYFDLQTYTIHHPKVCFKKLSPERTKVNAYPVSIISGQFQEYYRKYTSEELRYYPIKTAILDPPKPVPYQRPLPPGIKSPAVRNEKSQHRSDGEDVSSSSEDDNAQDNMKEEAEYAQKISSQEDDDNRDHFPKLDKKFKITQNKKFLKGKTHSSPEKIKSMKKSSNKDNDKETKEDSAKNESEDKPSPDGKKVSSKIHGLEKCRICKQRSTKEERKRGGLVRCAQCQKIGHMNCLDLTAELVAVIKTYPWQCMECKTCVECQDPYDEDKMMFCDRCDRGYHTFCIGLNALPTGHWECKSCGGNSNVETGISSLSKGAVRSETKTTLKEKVDGSENDKAKEIPSEETLENKVKEEKDDLATETTEPESVPDANHPSMTTPGIKSETRGRKRKNPDTVSKPVKTERIQGARQSRRLQLKEEEEIEKRKKEEKEKKMKKKKKKLLKAADALNANNTVGAEMNVTGEGQAEKKFDQALVQDINLACNKDIGIPDDLKDIVCEGVDDSVSLFDKQEDEENENPSDVLEISATDQLGKMESNFTSCEREKAAGFSEKESSSDCEKVGGSLEKGDLDEDERGISEKDNTVEHEKVPECSGVGVTNEDGKALGLSKINVTSKEEKISEFSEKESVTEHEEMIGILGRDKAHEHEKMLEGAWKETASDGDNCLVLSEKDEISEQAKALEGKKLSLNDHARELDGSKNNSAIDTTKLESDSERVHSDAKSSETFTEKVAIPEQDTVHDGSSIEEIKAVTVGASTPDEEQNYIANEQSAPSHEAESHSEMPAAIGVLESVNLSEAVQVEQEVTAALEEHASVSPGMPAEIYMSNPAQVEPTEVVTGNTFEGHGNVHSSQAQADKVTERT